MSTQLPLNSALTSILDFVEGRIDEAAFEQRLYNDPAIESVLNEDATQLPGMYGRTSIYSFLIEQNFKDPGGLLNVHGALSEFLERRHISCQPTRVHSELYDIILKAQPSWLDVRSDWLQQKVLSEAQGKTGKALKEWLRARLLELFKFHNKPPKWIQGPNWPIGENGPLVFLGQMKIPDYFHDEAAAYLFHDPTTGRCETVIQVY